MREPGFNPETENGNDDEVVSLELEEEGKNGEPTLIVDKNGNVLFELPDQLEQYFEKIAEGHFIELRKFVRVEFDELIKYVKEKKIEVSGEFNENIERIKEYFDKPVAFDKKTQEVDFMKYIGTHQNIMNNIIREIPFIPDDERIEHIRKGLLLIQTFISVYADLGSKQYASGRTHAIK